MRGLRVDAQVARELNRATVFYLLRSTPAISRVDIARQTGLSKATISEIIDHFLRAGFVRTLGPGPGARGRRPVLLEFQPAARLAIGIELSDTGCFGVITDLNGQVLRALGAPERSLSLDEAIEAAAGLIADLRHDVPVGSLLGVGVGTPGFIDPCNQTIQYAPSQGWRDAPVGPRLAERCGLPVTILNRAKAASLGEAWCGAGSRVDSLAYVSIGSGIAAGIVIDRQLHRGASLSEGELAHVTVLPDGPLCHCGNRGCLSALASTGAILTRIRASLRERGERHALLEQHSGHTDDPLLLAAIADAAASRNPAVLEALGQTAEYVGIASANLINTLDPAMVIFGGSLIRALPSLVPAIEAVIRRRVVPAAAGVQVVPSLLERDAVPIGAAAFLLSRTPIVGSSEPRLPEAAPAPSPGRNQVAVAPLVC